MGKLTKEKGAETWARKLKRPMKECEGVMKEARKELERMQGGK